MTNTRVGPCPSCGGTGLIPDGTYSYANETIQFLTGPQTSLDKLRVLDRILKSARLQASSREEVINKINEEDSDVAKWFSDVLPAINNSAQWIAVLIALIALAIQIQTSYFKKDMDIKDKFIEHLLEDQKNIKLQKQSTSLKTSKIPRNAPCPCNSGKKYKKCCGQ